MASSIIPKSLANDIEALADKIDGNFVFVYNQAFDADTLFANGCYRNTNNIIANCPEADGHLFVIGVPTLGSRTQFYVNASGSHFWMRTAWGAGSTSFTNSWTQVK